MEQNHFSLVTYMSYKYAKSNKYCYISEFLLIDVE